MGRRARLLLALLPLATCPALLEAADMPGMPGMAMHASGNTQSKVAGAYRIELHVLAPEEFYAAAEVAARHISAGMLIVGGATPVAPDAAPRPNHHLIVHVFDATSGAAVTDAKVRMKVGDIPVPVVTMQAIGAGAASTHYGNNVVLPPGDCWVTVNVNSATARFRIKNEP
jgi:hypothetical protein